jgi:hypothetical protein
MSEMNVIEIGRVLDGHGDRFAGNDVADMSEAWAEAGFSAADVDLWCRIGVWEPSVAAEFRDAGASPDDIVQAVERMTDDIHPDDLAERWTGGNPIYSVCNYDTPVSEILKHYLTR